MSAQNHAKIIKAIEWLNEAVQGVQYGDIGITLSVHNGEVKKIFKTITEKIQDQEPSAT